MFEGFPCVFDGGDEAVSIVFGLKVTRKKRDQIVPPGLSHFLVKRRASNDGKFLSFGREKNKQAVFIRGRFEAQRAEFAIGRSEGIADVAMRDEENDISGCILFRRPNGLMDAVMLQGA